MVESEVKVNRVILWTAPRCMSTAFERAIIERGDCHILHEPFCQPYYWGNEEEVQTKIFEKDARINTTFNKTAHKIYDE